MNKNVLIWFGLFLLLLGNLFLINSLSKSVTGNAVIYDFGISLNVGFSFGLELVVV